MEYKNSMVGEPVLSTRFMQDQINKEICEMDYVYGEDDRLLLQEMFWRLNQAFGTDYHYLSQIASQLVPNASSVVAPFFEKFHSESVRAYLIPQLTLDKPPGCDELLYRGYLSFKSSDCYISKKGQPAPAHIYARYDNGLKRLKPKRLKNELSELAECPRDAVYLPFTMRMLASWKVPSVEAQITRYLSALVLPPQEFGFSSELENSLPSLAFMRKQLLFCAIACSVYYPSETITTLLQSLETTCDKDIQAAAKKSVKIIRGR